MSSTFHPLEALVYLQDFYSKCISAFQKYIDGDMCSSYPNFIKQQIQNENDENNDQNIRENEDAVAYAASNMVYIILLIFMYKYIND